LAEVKADDPEKRTWAEMIGDESDRGRSLKVPERRCGRKRGL
jgi:hypothetical protein